MRQEKTIFCTFFVVFAISFVNPLVSCAQKFSFGFKGGAGLSWAGFGDKEQKDTFSTKPIFNYVFGLQVGFPLKNDFQLKLEGAYARDARRLLFNKNVWDNRTQYNFLEAQMLLQRKFKINLRENLPGEFFLGVGPDINYWLSSKGSIVVNGNKPGVQYDGVFDEVPTSDFTTMYYNNVNRWLFGLVLGAGIKAPLRGNSWISSEIRFVSGHTFLGERNSSHIEILGYDDTQFTNIKSLNLVLTYAWDLDVKGARKGKSTLKKKIKKNQ